MLIWSKICVFELRPTKFGGLVDLPKCFPKMLKKVGQSSPVLGKSGPNFKILAPISHPQGVLGGNFGMGRYGALDPT